MKKIFLIITVLCLMFFITSCERFEKSNEKPPADYAKLTDLTSADVASYIGICEGDKNVYVITPGLKEIASAGSLFSSYGFGMDSVDKRYYADDIDTSKPVVIFYCPGVSAKGCGAAGISVNEEILRAQSIFDLKEDHDITIIEVNFEKYDAKTDGKSVLLFDSFFSQIDCLVVSSERNCNIFRNAQVKYKWPCVEVKLLDIPSIVIQMIGA